MVWQRPQRLLPPRVLEALAAVQAGDAPRALHLLGPADREDILTTEAVRLVRGLAAAETGETQRAHQLLRPLLRASDPGVALAATLASVELRMRQRSFAGADPWLRRARRQATDEPTALVLDTALLRLQLRRGGVTTRAELAPLQQRLQRRHPAAVHASVHLLAAERALYAGDLEDAARAERTAHPYVDSAQLASLRRWHLALDDLLRSAPVARVEDWRRPARAMCRAELADLQREPWQLWVDVRHRVVLDRPRVRTPASAIHFDAAPAAWEVLALLLESPEHRLTWPALQRQLASPDAAWPRARASSLLSHLQLANAGALLRVGTAGCSLAARRFVVLRLSQAIPAHQERILAHLAAHPGSRAMDLMRVVQAPRRTLLRHLHALRIGGLVLIVGGGREARYWAI